MSVLLFEYLCIPVCVYVKQRRRCISGAATFSLLSNVSIISFFVNNDNAIIVFKSMCRLSLFKLTMIMQLLFLNQMGKIKQLKQW